MRRIRTQDPGAVVLLERSKPQRSQPVRLEVEQQIAFDLDVRKLVDRLRLRLGERLRGVSTPALQRHWSMRTIDGSPHAATTTIDLTSNGGAAYLGRVADAMAAEVMPAVVAEWLADAIPKVGPVKTEPTPNTSAGPIPHGGRR